MKDLFFTYDIDGYTKAKEWIKQYNLENEIEEAINEQNGPVNSYTYVALANSLRIRKTC
jgi:hypothetical protein